MSRHSAKAKFTQDQIRKRLSSSKKTTFYIYAFCTSWDCDIAKQAARNTSNVSWLGGGRIRCKDQMALGAYTQELKSWKYAIANPCTGMKFPGTGPKSYVNAMISAWTPS
jgi:hypothetical protein